MTYRGQKGPAAAEKVGDTIALRAYSSTNKRIGRDFGARGENSEVTHTHLCCLSETTFIYLFVFVTRVRPGLVFLVLAREVRDFEKYYDDGGDVVQKSDTYRPKYVFFCANERLVMKLMHDGFTYGWLVGWFVWLMDLPLRRQVTKQKYV